MDIVVQKKLNQILNKETTITSVATELGVSRQTLYKWLSQYKRQRGFPIFETQQKSYKAHNKISKDIEDLVISTAKNNPNDSVSTLATKLVTTYGVQLNPTTIFRVLKRNNIRYTPAVIPVRAPTALYAPETIPASTELPTAKLSQELLPHVIPTQLSSVTKAATVPTSALSSHALALPSYVFRQFTALVLVGVFGMVSLYGAYQFDGSTSSFTSGEPTASPDFEVASKVVSVFDEVNPSPLSPSTFSLTSLTDSLASLVQQGPRIAKLTLLPLETYQSFALGGYTVEAQRAPSVTNANAASFLDRLSLTVFCSLSANKDASRCSYDTLLALRGTPDTTTILGYPVEETPTVVAVATSTPSTTQPSPRIVYVPQYITNYVTEYVLGTPGKDGKDGKDGTTTTLVNNTSIPSGFGSYSIPSVTSPSLIGATTIGYLRDATIEKATVSDSIFNGYNLFNNTAIFTGFVGINSLAATTSVLTNTTITTSTTTDAFISNLSSTNNLFTNATTTNSYISALVASSSTLTDALLTNSTTTRAYIANLIASSSTLQDVLLTNATTTNAYIQNLVVASSSVTDALFTNATTTNLVATNATSTSLFAQALTAVSSFFTNLTATNATTTNLIATNATSTNLFAGTGFVTHLTTTSATSTNLFSTNAFFTNLDATNINLGNATTTNFVATNATTTSLFTQNLAVGNATTQGNQTVNGDLTVNGTTTIAGNITLGTSTATYVSFNGLINSNVVPAANKMYDLGSPSFYWRDLYADNINVNTISAASTTISGTSNNTFSINSDNASSDAEDVSLIFFRGLVTPNALLRWNATTKRLESNMSFKVQNETPITGTTTLTVQAGAGQGTTNLLEVKNNAGTNLTVIDANGRVGIGSSTPSQALTVVGNASIGGNVTATGTLTTPNAVITNATTTFFAAVNATTTNATTTRAYITSLVAASSTLTDALLTRSTTTDAYITRLVAASSTLQDAIVTTLNATTLTATNATLTNASTTNLSATGATLTNLFSSVLNAVTALFTNLSTTGTTTLATGGGNVGIGTVNPGAKLEISATAANTPTFKLTSTEIGGDGYLAQLGSYGSLSQDSAGAIYTTWGSHYNGSTNAWVRDYTGLPLVNTQLSTNGEFMVNTETATSGVPSFTTRLMVANSGNVGVGTTNPGTKLEVNAAAPTRGILSKFVNTSSNTTGAYLSIAASGANVWSMGLPASGSPDFAFFSGRDETSDGNERMRITSTGNVGIGTTNPGTKLEVSGGLAISDASYLRMNGVDVMNRDTNLNFWAGSGNVIFNNGNVGIGTTTPSYKLDVNGNFRNTGDFMLSNGAFSSSGSTITSNSDFFNVNSSSVLLGNDTSDTVSISGGTMYFPGNGKVGVGTNNPTAKFEVSDNGIGAFEGFSIQSSYSNSSPNSKKALTWRDPSNIVGSIDTRYDGINGVDMVFGSLFNGGYNTTDRMIIKGDGSVGIGTTTPSSKFEVVAADGPNQTIAKFTHTGQQNLEVLGQWGSQNLGSENGIYLARSGGSLGFGVAGNNAQMLINSSGNVGIGYVSPDTPLFVSKDSAIANSVLDIITSMRTTSGTAAAGMGARNRFVLEDAGGSLIQTGGILSYWVDPATGVRSSNTEIQSSLGNSSVTVATFTGGGNVGIGTTNPGARLEVTEAGTGSGSGGLTLSTANVTGNAGLKFATAGSNRFSITTIGSGGSESLRFRDENNNAERMRISSNGNVGIGTTTPVYKLDVVGGGIRSDLSSGGYFDLSYANVVKGNLTVDATRMYVNTQTTNTIINANGGNVGIGTTTPGAKLQIDAGSYNANNRVLYVKNSDQAIVSTGYDTAVIQQNDAPTLRLVESGENLSTTLSSDSGVSTLSSSGILRLMAGGTYNAVGYSGMGGNLGLAVAANGFVGVGTTTPSQRLSVYEPSNSYTAIGLNNASANPDSRNWSLVSNFYNYGDFSINQSAALHGDPVLSGATSRLYVGAGGNVGIGTTTPVAKLSVAGDGQALFGPNAGWGMNLRIGGSGGTSFPDASVATTNGNLHIDAASGGFATYLNYYRGTAGVTFGDGNLGIVGSVDGAGKLSMRRLTTYDNTGYAGVKTYGTGDGYGLIMDSYYTGVGSPYTRNADIVASTGSTLDTAQLRFLTKPLGSSAQVAMLISADGNVGIGVTNPANKLDVAGGMAIGAYVANVAPTNGLVVSGRVGIGTISPGSNLEVASDSFTSAGTNNQYVPVVFDTRNNKTTFYIKRPSIHDNRNWLAHGFVTITSMGYGWGSQGNSLFADVSTYGALNADGSGGSVPFVGRIKADGPGNTVIVWLRGGATYETDGIVLDNDGSYTDIYPETYSSVAISDSAYGIEKGQYYGPTDIDRNSTNYQSQYTFGSNVGIGTTAPVARLDVFGGTTYSFPSTSGTNPVGVIARFKGGGTSGTLDFGNAGSGISWLQSTDVSDLSQNYRLLLNPNGGNVGIGTASPADKLTVQGKARFDYGGALGTSSRYGTVVASGNAGLSLIADGTIPSTPGPDLNFGTNQGYGQIIGANWYYDGSTFDTYTRNGGSGLMIMCTQNVGDCAAGDFLFKTAGAGTAGTSIGYSTPFVIKQGGNIGIGAAAPNTALEVTRAITFASVDTFPQFIVKDAAGGTGRQLGVGVDAGGFSFIQSLNRGIDSMPLSLQRYGGNVGIGTTTPGTSLSVVGNIGSTLDSFFNGVRVGQGPNPNATVSNSNIVFGNGAGNSLGASSYRNHLIGYNAGTNITTGGDNVIVGNISGYTNLTHSVSIGANAGARASSVIIGSLAGQFASVDQQVLIGYSAGRVGSGGVNTVAIGYSPLANNTGAANIGIGQQALTFNTSGSYNTAIGYNAGFGSGATGYPTIVDTNSGFIGTSASRDGALVSSSTPLNNAWAIGENARVGSSNTIALGGMSSNAVRVGIGTSTPGSRLDIWHNTASSNVDIFRIATDVGSTNNIKFRIDSDGDVFTDGGTTIGTPADLAENYPALEALDAGTVVAFGSSTVAWEQADDNASSTQSYDISGVQKATNGYEAVGVVSTKAGITLGGNTTNGVPIALAGRVPVKVTSENGEVKRGDYLTVSNTMPGYAMKLTQTGRVIGRALSDSVSGRDKVMMYIENGYQQIDLSSSSATTTLLTKGNLALDANGVAIINIKSLSSANGTWSIDESGRIVAKALCIDGTCLDGPGFKDLVEGNGSTPKNGAMHIIGAHAFLLSATTHTLRVLDIAAGDNPVIVASLTLPEGVTSLSANGTYLYVNNSDLSMLYIVDVTSPTQPTLLRSINTGLATEIVTPPGVPEDTPDDTATSTDEGGAEEDVPLVESGPETEPEVVEDDGEAEESPLSSLDSLEATSTP